MLVPNLDEKKDKGNIDQVISHYLEPIPLESFIRHKILNLFLEAGLEDFQAQILLSIVLHGGQIKPITLAKDIHCNPSRLELPDGFPSLVDLNLISMSHTRPKTAILAISIDELLDRLTRRKIKHNDLLDLESARRLLDKLDQFCVSDTSQFLKKAQPDDFSCLLNYFINLEQLHQKIPSLSPLLYYSLSSLGMRVKYALIITKLIIIGGKHEKRNFYHEQLKENVQEVFKNKSITLEDDLQKLGYSSIDRKKINEIFNKFVKKNQEVYKFSNEHQFNMALTGLKEFCQLTSMSIKERSRKTKYITLVKTLKQIGNSLFQDAINYRQSHESELRMLKLAYSNVKLVDRDIFLSTIADSSSTRKRLETDIKYATKIYLVLIHPYFVDDIFQKIFDSENISCELHLIAAEEQKDLFIKMLTIYKTTIQGKRGISSFDKITLIPADEIPQDILVGNTIILFYDVGSSMIIIHEEITENNPTEINTIFTDVELAFINFNELKKENQEKTMNITSLIGIIGD